MTLLDSPSGDNCSRADSQSSERFILVDSAQVAKWIQNIPATPIGAVDWSIDPVGEYFARALDCPRQLLSISLKTGRGVSLDSTCKL